MSLEETIAIPESMKMLVKPKELYDSLPGDKGYSSAETFNTCLYMKRDRFFPDWPLVTPFQTLEFGLQGERSSCKLKIVSSLKEAYQDYPEFIEYVEMQVVFAENPLDTPLDYVWSARKLHRFLGLSTPEQSFYSQLYQKRKDFFPGWPEFVITEFIDLKCSGKRMKEKAAIIEKLEQAYQGCEDVISYIAENKREELISQTKESKQRRRRNQFHSYIDDEMLVQIPGMVYVTPKKIEDVTSLSSEQIEQVLKGVRNTKKVCGERVYPILNVFRNLKRKELIEPAQQLAEVYRRPILSLPGHEKFVPPEWLEIK